MPKRQLILVRMPREEDPEEASNGSAAATLPLGVRDEVLEALARYNTAPDRSPEKQLATIGTVTCYGPGLVVDLAGGAEARDEIAQLLVTLTDEAYAWPVLMRICRECEWRMMDPESGRTFG